ncbi:phosphodiester glycosidase family protein [Amycolatopsis sp. NPDC051045]|uniref:phosphodiester glycosidase family protein n=1 Tax=Amycolatopsis sp. NPDC051045 TaxID=3156922 RepID=UPI0034135A0A
MTLRLWRESWPRAGQAITRVVCLEIDLADQISSTPTYALSYRQALPQPYTDDLLRHAQYYSVFGRQAPAHRSVLLFVGGRGQEDATHEVRWHGTALVDRDRADYQLLKTAAERRALVAEPDGRVTLCPDAVLDDHDATLACLERLDRDGRLVFYPAGKSDLRLGPKTARQPVDLVVPINPMSTLLSREAVTATAGFNGSYFVIVEEEFVSDPFSFAMDPIGLVITDEVVVNPPIYRRPAFLVTRETYGNENDDLLYRGGTRRALIRTIGPENWSATLPGGVVVAGRSVRLPGAVPMAVNPAEDSAECSVWTPAARAAGTFATPRDDDRVDFVVVGETVVGLQEGGGTHIPMNAAVIGLRKRYASTVVTAIRGGDRVVEHHVDCGPDAGRPVHGTQGWVPLVRDGQPCDPLVELAGLDFAGHEHGSEDCTIPPVFLPDRYVVEENHAHLAIGLTGDGRMYVLHAEGCEVRTYREGRDSQGASPIELRDRLLALGCVEAIAMDGGGSAAIMWKGGLVSKPSDRFDVSQIAVERILPGMWLLHRE